MKIIPIAVKGNPYSVYLGGALSGLGRTISQAGLGGRVMVVADRNVASLYAGVVVKSLRAAGLDVKLLEVPPGEKSKTFSRATDVVGACAEFRMERSDTIVTLGGGVVSDLGGFAASIYKRGINFVPVPTSLLAMVDAAVGGKTGVNLPCGKNLAGTFHQPALVYIDTGTLASLPERRMREGMAEIVKCGVIKSSALFARIEAKGRCIYKEDLTPLIDVCVRIKGAVVEKDDKERTGLREILNFGHTLGHAVETIYMPRYAHGEAVALGMLGETFLAWKLGLCAEETFRRLSRVLGKVGLPFRMARTPVFDILESLVHDKKVRGGKLRFALPRRIGLCATGVEIAPEFIREHWEDLCHE